MCIRDRPVAAQVIADCFPFAKTRSQAIMKTTLVRIVVPKFQEFVKKRGNKGYYVRGTYTPVSYTHLVAAKSHYAFKSNFLGSPHFDVCGLVYLY